MGLGRAGHRESPASSNSRAFSASGWGNRLLGPLLSPCAVSGWCLPLP